MIIFKSIINPFRSIQEGIDELHEIPSATGADGAPSIAPTSFDNINNITSLQWPVELCEAGSQWSTIHDACIGLSGCTDPTAYNYDPNATIVDNNACIATVNGCTDATANNYNAAATTDDGSCTYDVYGCTDATACNYDEAANTDDGSCTFAVADFDCAGNCLNGGTSTTIQNRVVNTAGTQYSLSSAGGVWSLKNNATGTQLASNADGDDVTLCLPDGCYDLIGNSNSGASGFHWGYDINSTGTYTTAELPVLTGWPAHDSHQFTVGAGVCTVLGCTDTTANNYDSQANTDDGLCTYDVPGCMDSTANNYNAAADTDDGSCTYDVNGCTDATANNYNAAATVDDGTCTYDVNGCTDATANNYNAAATVDDGSCQYDVPGCMNTTANNYDPAANVDNGSCTYNVNGCTDADATNFIATATTDDGSCYIQFDNVISATLQLYDSHGYGWDGSLIRVTDSGGNPAVLKTIQPSGDNTGIGPGEIFGPTNTNPSGFPDLVAGEFTIDNPVWEGANTDIRAEKTIVITFPTTGEYTFTFIPGSNWSDECSWELYINGATTADFVSTAVDFDDMVADCGAAGGGGDCTLTDGVISAAPFPTTNLQSVILNAIATIEGTIDITPTETNQEYNIEYTSDVPIRSITIELAPTGTNESSSAWGFVEYEIEFPPIAPGSSVADEWTIDNAVDIPSLFDPNWMKLCSSYWTTTCLGTASEPLRTIQAEAITDKPATSQILPLISIKLPTLPGAGSYIGGLPCIDAAGNRIAATIISATFTSADGQSFSPTITP